MRLTERRKDRSDSSIPQVCRPTWCISKKRAIGDF